MRFLFSDLCNLLGQRIDSAPVLALSERIGAEAPRPTSFSFSNSEGCMSHDATGLEIGWTHEILAPQHYPPRKSGRHFICWVYAVWFDPAFVDGLPFNLRPSASPEDLLSAVPERIDEDTPKYCTARLMDQPQLTLTVPRAPGPWRLELIQMQRYATLSRDSTGNSRPGWHYDAKRPVERADLASGFFLAWCIFRNLVGARHHDHQRSLLDDLRHRRMSIMDYAYATCFAGELWSWDVDEKVRDFAFDYFKALCHRNSAHPRLGRADRCHPDDDLDAVVIFLSDHGGLGTQDQWSLFERFSLLLDARWTDYHMTGLETEVSRRTAMQLTILYRSVADQLRSIPAPR
ncbi:hypothetical protein C1922_15365 [Stenotrophomonas sp. ZAC14D2_NAIMI4_7]|uniref:DUF7832 domain-containing protein n=1 Tax=Stenotrophomonas sp. ZAC14D2_NAIMI4_7 TaxID=2072405 RepID=UPI000D5403B0|nr:hypothetical protein [Stenotrophomonas sp. ZAC14D2_NAIMI4_7]AWH18582.1 hypothetical protein C1922_15365 [Stenotrophomonas sp. ZAC14D2_NAIMI4_7]